MTRIKICGLFRPCDIEYVNEARPDWCGFIINFPKSRRSRTPAQVRALRERLDRAVVPVGVFVDQPAEVVAYAREKLPRYMVPNSVRRLERLPQTPNGKIDRKGLQEQALAR